MQQAFILTICDSNLLNEILITKVVGPRVQEEIQNRPLFKSDFYLFVAFY